MYADRFARSGGIKPGSLIAAVGINGGLIVALLFSAPIITKIIPDRSLITENIPIDKPPPPERQPELKPQPRQQARPIERIETTTTIVPRDDAPFALPYLPRFPTTGTVGDVVVPQPLPTATLVPIMTTASPDSRYARDFQPDYPPGERRAAREGRVVLRVLIGADGRVRQAERISADSDAFWRVTERQALSRWRFVPATRDGVAIESWRTMTVRFTMTD